MWHEKKHHAKRPKVFWHISQERQLSLLFQTLCSSFLWSSLPNAEGHVWGGSSYMSSVLRAPHIEAKPLRRLYCVQLTPCLCLCPSHDLSQSPRRPIIQGAPQRCPIPLCSLPLPKDSNVNVSIQHDVIWRFAISLFTWRGTHVGKVIISIPKQLPPLEFLVKDKQARHIENCDICFYNQHNDMRAFLTSNE